ncbi:MAG: nitroreductase family protein [Clostridiales bacterium]|nr:nitroreductase family protein [Clostridiales bacterium]
MLELMRNRRSIRKFLDKPIEPNKLDSILECALRSPSSMGRQPWKITVVQDKNLLDKLSWAKPSGGFFIKESAIAYVVAGYPQITPIWIEDCSIVSTVIQLEAESLGLGSCWVQIRGRMHDDDTSASDNIKSLLELDTDCEVLCVIAVGYKGENKQGHKDIPYEKSELK